MTNSPNKPSVSIIVPAYKCEKFLQATADSVLNQTISDWELIIIDDGSPGATPELVDKIGATDPRIKCAHQKNGGMANARNVGYAMSDGSAEYVLFLDADDCLMPNALERMLSALEKRQDASAVSSDDQLIDENGTPFERDNAEDRRHNRYIASRNSTVRQLAPDEADTTLSLVTWNGIRTPGCVLMRRENYEKIGAKFREELLVTADWAMWIAMAKTGPILRLDEKLLQYRIHGSNASKNLKVMQTEVRNVRREILDSPNFSDEEKATCIAGYRAVEKDGIQDKLRLISDDFRNSRIKSGLIQCKYLLSHTARYVLGRP